MQKTSLIARLAALGASAVVTFAIVAALAGYALPLDSGAQLMARAAVANAK